MEAWTQSETWFSQEPNIVVCTTAHAAFDKVSRLEFLMLHASFVNATQAL